MKRDPKPNPLLSKEALLDASARGLSQIQYAQEAGVNYYTLHAALRRNKVTLRDGRKDKGDALHARNAEMIAYLEAPHTFCETAVKFGVTFQRVQQINKRGKGKRGRENKCFSAVWQKRHTEIVARLEAKRAALAERKRRRRELAETFAAGRLEGRGTHEMAREYGCTQTLVSTLIGRFFPELVLLRGQRPAKVFGCVR